MSANLKQLEQRRESLTKQIETLNARLEELNAVIDLLKDQQRPDLTETLNTLLNSAGEEGLTVEEATEMGGFNKSSVAVTLSRMKKAGRVIKRDTRYIVKPPA